MLFASVKTQIGKKYNIGKMHVNTNQKRIITSKQNKEYVQEQRGSF